MLISGLPAQAAEPEGAEAAEARAAAALVHALGRLKDDDWGVRKVALSAIGELAPRAGASATAAGALEVLSPHLSDEDEDVRSAAAAAVGKVSTEGDTEAARLLIPLLDDQEEDVRAAAVRAFALVSRPGDQEAMRRRAASPSPIVYLPFTSPSPSLCPLFALLSLPLPPRSAPSFSLSLSHTLCVPPSSVICKNLSMNLSPEASCLLAQRRAAPL